MYKSIIRPKFEIGYNKTIPGGILFTSANNESAPITEIPEDTPVWKQYTQSVEESIPEETVDQSEQIQVTKPVQSTQPVSESKVELTSFEPVYTTKNGKRTVDMHATKAKFVSTLLPLYTKVLEENGISSEYAKSLVAQAGHESAWGTRPSGKNNYTGMKVPSKEKGKGKGTLVKTWEEFHNKRHDVVDEFRNYESIEDMVRHHIALLSGKRYAAFSGPVMQFADRVKAGGYATDSEYVKKLKDAIASIKHGGKWHS